MYAKEINNLIANINNLTNKTKKKTSRIFIDPLNDCEG